MESPYLIGGAKPFHRFWWTCVPALPPERSCAHYDTLKRIWSDPTMNFIRPQPDGTYKSGARGCYREPSEDFLTPFLFQTWAIFDQPDQWVPLLLEVFGQRPIGTVRGANWCYLFEQPYEARQICIADIVFSWRDEAGDAVLVLEAKVPKGKLTKKDIDGADRYLRMPSIAAVPRRTLAFLVDAADRNKVLQETANRFAVGTWQALVDAQLACTRAIPNPKVRREIAQAICANARSVGIEADVPESPGFAVLRGHGTDQVYRQIRKLDATEAQIAFLLGTEVRLACRQGYTPKPPLDWLEDEPDVFAACDASSPTRQTTADRRVPRWRLPPLGQSGTGG